jgi:general secretion pathway protein D
LKFTPQVFPNQDVQVKMSIESKDVLGASTLTPTFTERTITGTARVQNNRTMMLASVSTDISSEGRKGIPILSGLPILGRLFSAPTRDDRRIDIVIAVTPRVLRAPAVTPRDLEMRPSGTLQSPTTGSLEAMMREADREDNLAELRLQKKNSTAKAAEPHSNSLPGVFPSNPSTGVSGGAVAQTPVAPAANDAVAMNVAKNSGAEPAAAGQPSARTPSSAEEMPAFVPAPKSLVSSTAATEVAAVNTNLTSDARATLTSMAPKPIDAAISPISAKGRNAQLTFGPADQSMRVGETRRFALDVKADIPLAMAIVALRFDPKVVKVKAVGLDGSSTMLTQSTDASGVCLISVSNLSSMVAPGTLIYIDVEGIAVGDAGLLFDKVSSHLIAIDARDLVVEVTPARATVKQ